MPGQTTGYADSEGLPGPRLPAQTIFRIADTSELSRKTNWGAQILGQFWQVRRGNQLLWAECDNLIGRAGVGQVTAVC